MRPVAIIFGVTGQDGALLARLLLEKGYEVWGGSRDARKADRQNLEKLGIAQQVRLITAQPADKDNIVAVIAQCRPREIYHLGAQSSVGRSFEIPGETVNGIVLGTLNVLEAVRMTAPQTRLFIAGSGECFGDTGEQPANEETPFRPASPYAVAKASAYWLTRTYRESYGLFACTGVLFNHESTLRPEHFVTQKIVRGAQRIRDSGGGQLTLGRLDIWRDWGWAPEYVEAMWRMLQLPVAEDFIIATGESFTLRDFVAAAFAAAGLEWQAHVLESAALHRPSDILRSRANPDKARRLLGWEAKYGMRDVVRMMLGQQAEVR